jgi:hypothetical protein
MRLHQFDIVALLERRYACRRRCVPAPRATQWASALLPGSWWTPKRVACSGGDRQRGVGVPTGPAQLDNLPVASMKDCTACRCT